MLSAPWNGLAFMALCAPALVCGSSLEAQTLRGRVVDAETGEAVQLAYVALLEDGREAVAADLADLRGVFALEAPSRGAYFLYVRRDGYQTLTDGLFELGSDGMFEVRVGLTPEPIELESLVVETNAKVSRLQASGFFDRVLTAPGHFLTREDIERADASRVADLFRGVPRIQIDASRPLVGPDVMQNPSIFMRRGGMEKCSPTLYIDRHVINTGVLDAVRPDDYVSSSEIEAIEVYGRASQVPPEFDPINDCGVVLIWTRIR